MKSLYPFFLFLLGTSLTEISPLFGQIPVELSVTPARTYGHARQTLNTQEANLVEGRELNLFPAVERSLASEIAAK